MLFQTTLTANLFCTSSFPREIIISYIPGPNLDPVKIILRGWPTPLKFVLFDLIKFSIIGSKSTLSNLSNFEIVIANSEIIFFALSSINFKSSWLKFTLSLIIYFELL